MMKRILLAAGLVLIVVAVATAVFGQAVKPPVNAVAGPTTAAQFYSITPDINVKHATETPVAVTITSNTLTINLALGSVFTLTNNANINTFAITNPTAGRVNSFRMYITSDGNSYTQTWSGVRWGSGSQAVLTAVLNHVDIIACETPNGGTNWYCVPGYNFF